MFTYRLPSNLIAQTPASPRDHSRLMLITKKTKTISHYHFFDLPKLLPPDCLLVLNQTKVFPARLVGKKETGVNAEILLLHQNQDFSWQAIGQPRLKTDHQISFQNNLIAQVINHDSAGNLTIKFNQKNIFDYLAKFGQTPLPPYISNHSKNIKNQYQTIYAKNIGSAAAPTAGLHFTQKTFTDLTKKGIQLCYLTLHVGLGTFQPLRPHHLASGHLHREFFSIPISTQKTILQAKKQGRPIIAVGTTSARALESDWSCPSTDIFIKPPYKFKIVDGLITNFHLPGTSLLMLVSALAGQSLIKQAYQTAIDQNYRFYSFGDCMLII